MQEARGIFKTNCRGSIDHVQPMWFRSFRSKLSRLMNYCRGPQEVQSEFRGKFGETLASLLSNTTFQGVPHGMPVTSCRSNPRLPHSNARRCSVSVLLGVGEAGFRGTLTRGEYRGIFSETLTRCEKTIYAG